MRTLTDADRHAARFDRRLQGLCGCGTYRSLIGHIDKTGAISLLAEDAPPSMVWDAS